MWRTASRVSARLGEVSRPSKVPLEIGVGDARLAAGSERVGDAQNDEASALSGIEDARTVTEPAGFVAQVAQLAVLQVEDVHRFDGLCDFLSVGADILYRRAADTAGNAAEALHAGAACADGVPDEAVPGFARADVEENSALVRLARLSPLFDPEDCDLQHQPGPARVCDQEVAATAQHKDGQVLRARKDDGLLDLAGGVGFDEKTRGPS